MKPFQQYIAELNKKYDFRVKICGDNPKDHMARIKDAIDTYELESISALKSMPVQEHGDFPKYGPCECWTFEVTVNYPVTTAQLRQVIRERCALPPDCICVYYTHEDDFKQAAENLGQDHQGAYLSEPELVADADAQQLVGQARTDSFLKQLISLKHEFAAPATSMVKVSAPSKDTQGPMTQQNKITSPFKGKK
jgi:hypothetical protein